jgi:hypothetical protein
MGSKWFIKSEADACQTASFALVTGAFALAVSTGFASSDQ